MSNQYARLLSNRCHIPLTSDLGNYLGIPLRFSRPKREDYNFIFQKIQKRLSSWKAKFLSLAGRATLIQAVTSAIPNYAMQTDLLPDYVCDKLDQINRNFLWGDMEGKKKIHLVNWEKVCRPKKEGGLGLRKSKFANRALVAKMGWKLLREDSNLWVSLLEGKYNFDKRSPNSWELKKRNSRIWRSIIHTKNLLVKGLRWIVGNGESISLWNDWWCGTGPLVDSATVAIVNHNERVSTIMEDGMGWQEQDLRLRFDNETVKIITATPFPRFTEFPDTPTWGRTGNGIFSSKSAYESLIEPVSTRIRDVDWEKIWKLNIPHKLKAFLWLVLLNKLPTNSLRFGRGMAENDLCHICGERETVLHVLRDCHRSAQVWKSFSEANNNRDFWDLPLLCWVKKNVKNQDDWQVWGLNWKVAFIIVSWCLWKARNVHIFEDKDEDFRSTIIKSEMYAREISHALDDKGKYSPVSIDSNFISWCFPPAGTCKINTDGAVKRNGKVASFGGLCRNDNGNWMFGFSGFVGSTDSTTTELWGILHGLVLARDKGLKNFLIETDSLGGVTLLKSNDIHCHPCRGIIEDCKFFLDRLQGQITHTKREGNQCADFMANVGAHSEERLVIWDRPPIGMARLLQADSASVAFFRA